MFFSFFTTQKNVSQIADANKIHSKNVDISQFVVPLPTVDITVEVTTNNGFMD